VHSGERGLTTAQALRITRRKVRADVVSTAPLGTPPQTLRSLIRYRRVAYNKLIDRPRVYHIVNPRINLLVVAALPCSST